MLGSPARCGRGKDCDMGIKVAKFGGSSLADAVHFRRAAEIVRADPSRRFVVVSAPGKRTDGDKKVTDLLYRCDEMACRGEKIDSCYGEIVKRYEEIIRDLGLRMELSEVFAGIRSAILSHAGRDFVASRGEYLNARIFAAYLGFDFVDAEEVVFFHENGNYDEEKTNRVMREVLRHHRYAVIPGFYGAMPDGRVKTFGRGGSDVTGAIVACAAEADLYENWTDVSGCLMADPRIVPNPKPIRTLTYRELRELSYMGASVLHEEAVFPVHNAGIPIHIRNTNDPEAPGTMIVPGTNEYDSEHVITGIAGKKGFSVITIEKDRMNTELGFGRRILDVLEENRIPFEHLPSGVDTMSVILPSSALSCDGCRERILASVTRLADPDSVVIEDGMALLAVVGRGMVKATGTAARIFGAVSAAGINIRMIDQGSGELGLILGMDEADLEKATRAIYREFVREPDPAQ